MQQVGSRQHAGVSAILGMVSQTFNDWSPPILVSQQRINLFAAATGDDQGIHVDLEQAVSAGFDTTIAQGLLVVGFNALVQKIIVKRLERDYPGSKILHLGGCYKLEGMFPEGSFVRVHGRVASAEPPKPKKIRFSYAYEVAFCDERRVASGSMDLAGIFK